jgi:hypothetical protein
MQTIKRHDNFITLRVLCNQNEKEVLTHNPVIRLSLKMLMQFCAGRSPIFSICLVYPVQTQCHGEQKVGLSRSIVVLQL